MPKGSGRAISQSTMPVRGTLSGVYDSKGTIVNTIPVGFDGKPVPTPGR